MPTRIKHDIRFVGCTLWIPELLEMNNYENIFLPKVAYFQIRLCSWVYCVLRKCRILDQIYYIFVSLVKRCTRDKREVNLNGRREWPTIVTQRDSFSSNSTDAYRFLEIPESLAGVKIR